MKSKITFTLSRLFLFVFFTACYTFLTFWITSTIFLFFPFAIFGLILYIAVVLFHRFISKVADKNKGKEGGFLQAVVFIVTIAFAVGYIFLVYWMQGLMTTYFGISPDAFRIVGLVLELVSIGIGVFLSFFK